MLGLLILRLSSHLANKIRYNKFCVRESSTTVEFVQETPFSRAGRLGLPTLSGDLVQCTGVKILLELNTRSKNIHVVVN